MDSGELLKKIQSGRELLRSHLKPTSLQVLDLAANLWGKLEFQNPTGSFKDRPALYGVLFHREKAIENGVLAASSGNFAQAVAHAATKIGANSKIVMTSQTSAFKVQRTESFGGEVVFSGPSFDSREELSKKLREESGAVFLHPFDAWETMIGDGSLGLELLDQAEDDFDIFVPTSGGGLLAATAFVLKSLRPGCRVYGVQPKNNFSLETSFRAGSRQRVPAFQTICDSLIAVCPGAHTFSYIQKYVDDVFSPTEEQIREAMVDIWQRFYLKVEPGSATAWAACQMQGGAKNSRKKILALTGANVEDAVFRKMIQETMEIS